MQSVASPLWRWHLNTAPVGQGFGAAMSSSPGATLWNGDEDVAAPFRVGAVPWCAPSRLGGLAAFPDGTFLSVAALGFVVLLNSEPTAEAVGFRPPMRRRHPDAVAEEVLTPASLKTPRRQDWTKKATAPPSMLLSEYR